MPTVYFDAFAHDYLDDPFVGLAGELLAQLPDKDAHAQILKKAARGGSTLELGYKTRDPSSNAGAFDASDLEAVKDIGRDMAQDASSLASSYVQMTEG
jgi:hypothetical protein